MTGVRVPWSLLLRENKQYPIAMVSSTMPKHRAAHLRNNAASPSLLPHVCICSQKIDSVPLQWHFLWGERKDALMPHSNI